MAVNRYFTPAQTPQGFVPFQLPFEAMAQTAMLAQEQQDTVNEGLYNILDTDFNYIPIAPNEEAHKNILGDISSNVDRIRAMSENGDLRGLKGETYNYARTLKKSATSGDIYKLSSDYARLAKWEEDNKDRKLDDPTSYYAARQQAINNLEAAGGSLKSSFSQEDVLESYDWTDKVNTLTKDIEAQVIKRATVNSNGMYINNFSEAKKWVTQEEIFRIAEGYLSSDPKALQKLGQLKRFGVLSDDALPFGVTKEVEVKGKDGKIVKQSIYMPNEKNPAYGAFIAAMNKYDVNEYESKTETGLNSTWLSYEKHRLEQEEKAMMGTASFGEALNLGATGELGKTLDLNVKRIQSLVDAGDITTAKKELDALVNSSTASMIFNTVKSNPDLMKQINKIIASSPKVDSNGKTVHPDDLFKAFVLASQSSTKMGDSWGTDHTIGRTQDVLNSMGYNFERATFFNSIRGDFGKGVKRTSETSFWSTPTKDFADVSLAVRKELTKTQTAGKQQSVIVMPLMFNFEGNAVYDNAAKADKESRGNGFFLLQNQDGLARGTSIFNALKPNEKITHVRVGTPYNGKDLVEFTIEGKDKSGELTSRVLIGTSNSDVAKNQHKFPITSVGYSLAFQNPLFNKQMNSSALVMTYGDQLPTTYSNIPGQKIPIKYNLGLSADGKTFDSEVINYVSKQIGDELLFVPDVPGLTETEKINLAIHPQYRELSAERMKMMHDKITGQ
jgi:hypothetical protein